VKGKVDALMVAGFLGLSAYLVRCLKDQQTTTMSSVTKVTETITGQATDQMDRISMAFSTVNREAIGRVSLLAETILLGRDLPSQSESLPTSSSEEESSPDTEIDWSGLPETAQWAAEEEELLPPTTMPWQSSLPHDDLEMTLD
jgi:hypothetical protein